MPATKDEEWDTVFAAWFDAGHLGDKGAILIYSLGGGGCRAQDQRQRRARSIWRRLIRQRCSMIVRRDSGYSAKHGDVVVLITRVNPSWKPFVGGLPGRGLALPKVSHPALQLRQTKW